MNYLNLNLKMSNQSLNESDKNSIILYFDVNERIKKLEEIFESVDYTSPSPYEYKITITDKKINDLVFNRFNVMSSLHYLFISFNENLPIFRVNIDKTIKVESFDKVVENNKLIIKINEKNPSKFFQEKIKNINRKYFFNVLFQRIYYKYNYYNSKMLYIKNLKKKLMNELKYNYLYSLREREKDNKMKKIYYQKFIGILKEIHKEKQIAKTI